MKEQDLIKLGFERHDMKEDEDFGFPEYYYYVYDFEGIGISLISNTDDELVNGEWVVSEFESDKLVFTNVDDLTLFIQVVEKNIIP